MLGHASLWQSVVVHTLFEGRRCKQMWFEPIVLRATESDDLTDLGAPRAEPGTGNAHPR